MKELIPVSRFEISDYLEHLPEHAEIFSIIERGAPEAQRAKAFFGKHHSQFMDKLMANACLTPMRQLRQILAEREKIELAIKENITKLKETELKISEIGKKLDAWDLGFYEREELEKELSKLKIGMESSKIYVSAALRRLASFTEDYEKIKAAHNIGDFNEVDFEREEEKYHLMTAFSQALNGARCRGGVIDEGNLTYLHQIGVNGAAAQFQVVRYLQKEAKEFASGSEPTHKMTLDWLLEMAEHYKGCSIAIAKWKGLDGTLSEVAALKQGDMRLLGG